MWHISICFLQAFWAFIPFILAFWAFISFHFGILGLHFLSFWPFGPGFLSFSPFGPSFPFILAFWAFISFHFGLLGPHFLSFFACLGCHVGSPPTSCQKWLVSLMFHIKNLTAPGPVTFSNFWPFGPSFPVILAFWGFISFHFGLLGLHFLSAFLDLHLLSFFACLGCHVGPPPTSCQKWLVSLMFRIKNLTKPGPATFSNFWPLGLYFGFLGLYFLSFWPFGL